MTAIMFLLRVGSEGKAFLFYGHLDTVPVYGTWDTDPFKLTRKGDRLFGRGAADMKGGIAAFIDAVRVPTNRKIKVLLCSDEENISHGAWEAVRRRRAWFRDVDFVLSGEQGVSGGQTAGGAQLVGLGRRGRVVIAIDVVGRSAHGSIPNKGINAITEAAKIANAVENIKLRSHRHLPAETLFVRKLYGESTSLSIPEKAHVELDIHLVPPSTPCDIIRKVNALAAKLKRTGVLRNETRVSVSLKPRETPYLQPYCTDINDARVRRTLEIVREHVGAPKINYGTSVADENVFANELKAPVVTLGPKGGNCHASNEFVFASSMEQLVDIYSKLLNGV